MTVFATRSLVFKMFLLEWKRWGEKVVYLMFENLSEGGVWGLMEKYNKKIYIYKLSESPHFYKFA